jgi:outer membrane protein OmpA-like peptidoglycan-associated protein
MRRLGAALGALLLAGTATVALAQNYAPGPYIGFKGGLTSLEDQALTGIKGNVLNLRTDPDIGFGLLGFGGYSFGLWRIEGEVGYRRNDIGSLRVNNDGGLAVAQGQAAAQSGTTQPAGGWVDSVSTMVNGIIDVPFNFGGISPYVGAGLGIARVHQSRTDAAGTVRYVDDSQIRPAYQGIAGLSWNFSPHWSAALEYHYFATLDTQFTDTAGRRLDGEYKTHNAFLGITYHFGQPRVAAAPPPPPPAVAPPPPPPPAAAAPRPQPFLVFFDFDRSDITVEADRIIRAASDAWKRGGSPTLQIAVTGHTDKSGSDAYNQALSVRRANAVKAKLAQYGVPANVITTTGRGESEPLVPTADGVREPQNRRAEIVIRQ